MVGDETALEELNEDLRTAIYERKFEKAIHCIEQAGDKIKTDPYTTPSHSLHHSHVWIVHVWMVRCMVWHVLTVTKRSQRPPLS